MSDVPTWSPQLARNQQLDSDAPLRARRHAYAAAEHARAELVDLLAQLRSEAAICNSTLGTTFDVDLLDEVIASS